MPDPTVEHYVAAVSEYVRLSPMMTAGAAKTAQIALSHGLARAVVSALKRTPPNIEAFAGERNVAGALRVARADVSEAHELDGLRLAVEIKPINLAVGRAIWNRFGDIRAFAVNVHLKFPFAIVGGILVLPTWERKQADDEHHTSTLHLIERLVRRLQRTRFRESEADAAHLLEAVAVLVYDPDTSTLDENLPPPGSGLRWEEYIETISALYEVRFE
jgi:hypothetical protein